MPYGQLEKSHIKALKVIIKGKQVHDLGCGDELLARDLLKFGAKEVVGIDSNLCILPYYREVNPYPKGMTGIKTTFEEYAKTSPTIDVAFVSWPANREDFGLLSLVSIAKTVVYLGKCTDGTCCGWPGLFRHFLGRDLQVYIPDQYNTLIIYGRKLSAPRRGEYEEQAGLDWEKIQPYEEHAATG